MLYIFMFMAFENEKVDRIGSTTSGACDIKSNHSSEFLGLVVDQPI